jgi:hypothetical protein
LLFWFWDFFIELRKLIIIFAIEESWSIVKEITVEWSESGRSFGKVESIMQN